MTHQILRTAAVLGAAVSGLLAQAAAHDTPCSAFQTYVNTLTTTNNIGATITPSVAGSCNNGADVWFTITPPYSGVVEASTCASHSGSANFDTVLNVWLITNCSGAGVLLACNDDACGGVQSYVSFSVTVGVVYYISVGGYNGATGSFGLNLVETPTIPPNDTCATASPISVGDIMTIENYAATTGPDPVPTCGSSSMGRDVWYSFLAPACATYTVTTCRPYTSIDTIVGVWQGTCGSLVPVACSNNDFACTNWVFSSTVSFAGSPGTTYYISVGGYSNAWGVIDLTLNAPPSPIMSLHFLSNGSGTLGYTVANGPAGGLAFTAITLNAGIFPSGWFHGIDIPIPEVVNEWLLGAPFTMPLGASCASSITVGPFSGLPPGLTVYGVSLGISSGGALVPTVATLPTWGTVP